MAEPIIVLGKEKRASDQPPTAATGGSFDVHEWNGSGPGYLHVHHADDEAWHVLAGTLTFRFRDREVKAPAGTTVFVPAGVGALPHPPDPKAARSDLRPGGGSPRAARRDHAQV